MHFMPTLAMHALLNSMATSLGIVTAPAGHDCITVVQHSCITTVAVGPRLHLPAPHFSLH